MDQPITDPISGPSFDFTFTMGPELDNSFFCENRLWNVEDVPRLENLLLLFLLQVIRAQKTARRLQMTQSLFLNLEQNYTKEEIH